MSLQMTPIASNQIVDLRSVDASGRSSQQGSKFIDRLSDGGISLSLVHLDVSLAISAEGRDARRVDDGAACLRLSAERLARDFEVEEAASTSAKFDDPVTGRLYDALAAAEAEDGPHSAICADALRLAILTRQFNRQAEPAPVGITSDEDHVGRNIRSLQKWRLKRVVEYVDEHLGEKITLQDLAAVAGLSRMHFAAQFRVAMGMRPHEYLMKRRIERAEELLKQAELSLVEVALTVGFQTQAHFTTVFKRFAGDTPYQWRSAYLAQATAVPYVRLRLS